MKKILVVDDDANFLSSLIAKLSLGEYEVEGCGSGQEALEMIQDHSPDLVVLDLMLPDILGQEVLEGSKESSEVKKTKFVVCTNNDTKVDRKTCKELGASDYLIKADYTLDELVDKIKETLE